MSEEKPAESQPSEENKERWPKKDQKKEGKGFGKGKGGRRGPRVPEEEEWVPLTNLGRLVKIG